MYIISIDVGIKNLAYCLIYINDNKSCEIIQWDILNLMSLESKTCQAVKKTSEICGKTAKFTKNNCYYCKTHAKSQSYIIPSKDLNYTQLKRERLTNLKTLADKHGIKYTSPITKTSLLATIKTYLDDNLFSYVQTLKSDKVDLITLGKNILPYMDPIVNGFPIDVVLIENQISPLANRMKTLQGMITQYFIMKDISNIHFISSLNKLKRFVKSKKRRTYKERKKLGIHITNDILNCNNILENWKDYFNSNKKKDDLADSFLQGVWYIQSNNLATIDSTLKNL